MLVLRRGIRQSVVIGDQITVTVDEFLDEDDRRAGHGATVGLGFEMPRSISVFRKELRERRSHGGSEGHAAPRKQLRPGDIQELSGVRVRLQIEVPRKVPVCHNGRPAVGSDVETGEGGLATVYHITCQREDRITICNNIKVAALDFHRFIPRQRNACL